MQHANRSVFDSSDGNSSGGHSSSSNNNNYNINNNDGNNHNSIGAIGASTSGAMASFEQNSIVLTAFSSLHVALWKLCKLLSVSSTQQQSCTHHHHPHENPECTPHMQSQHRVLPQHQQNCVWLLSVIVVALIFSYHKIER